MRAPVPRATGNPAVPRIPNPKASSEFQPANIVPAVRAPMVDEVPVAIDAATTPCTKLAASTITASLV